MQRHSYSRNFLNTPTVYIAGEFFAFFALVTSFIGVAIGLVDFLADGFKIKKDFSGKLLLCLMVFLPPLAIASAYPHIFLQALDLAGGYGCAILLGLFPILMVWSARYRLGWDSKQLVPGGKWMLIILGIFVVFEILFEVKLTFDRLN
jgi:tyrosine-specific transport protein